MPDHDQVRAQRLAVGENDRFRVLAPLDRSDAKPKPEARPEGGVLFQEKIRHDRRDRPAHRARDLDHRRLGPEARGGRGDFEPDESGADDDDPGLRAEPLADRGRVGDVAKREHARQIDSRHIEPPLPRASRKDEMPIINRASVAELHLLRSAIDPRRADAEPQVDALLAKMRVGPKREPMDVHFAFEKRLGQAAGADRADPSPQREERPRRRTPVRARTPRPEPRHGRRRR